MKEYIILGVDPGTNVGLAFLDLQGKVIDVESGRNLSFSEVMYEVFDHGDPVLVATDKANPPELVRRIASVTNARLYTPPEDLTQQEKAELVKGYGLKNQHEKDALAAAIKAYNVHSGKIRSMLKKLDFKRAWLGEKQGEKPVKEKPPERIVIVEKKTGAEELERLKQGVKARDRIIRDQASVIDQQRKRIRKLEAMPRTADPLLKKQASDARQEARRLQEDISGMAKAVENKELEIKSKSKMRIVKHVPKTPGRAYTEDPSVFEECKQSNKDCTLIKVFYDDGNKVFYKTIDSFEASGTELLDRIVKEYKKRRESLFK